MCASDAILEREYILPSKCVCVLHKTGTMSWGAWTSAWQVEAKFFLIFSSKS